MKKVFPIRTNDQLDLTYERNEPYEYVFLPGYYLFELWGASGGAISPGFGAYVSGVLPIRESVTLYFYIGQKGVEGYSTAFNGGGKGCRDGSSGGGSTDVRLVNGYWNEFKSLQSRIIVAGGGGGSQFREYFLSPGGSGGIIKGEDGQKKKLLQYDIYNAKAGEQKKGGKGGTGKTNKAHEGTDGGFGYGGEGSSGNENGNGGGGGYFGGGGSATADNVVGSGAGGSSYISGYDGCFAILENSTIKDLYFSGDSLHYSNYYFTKISVKNGSEIKWDDNGKIHIRCLKLLNLSLAKKHQMLLKFLQINIAHLINS